MMFEKIKKYVFVDSPAAGRAAPTRLKTRPKKKTPFLKTATARVIPIVSLL